MKCVYSAVRTGPLNKVVCERLRYGLFSSGATARGARWLGEVLPGLLGRDGET
jgi:hypothetical protein